MLYDLSVAWRNVRSRPVQTIVPSFVIGLAIALALIIAMLADGTKEGIIKASDPFGMLVVGANGSSQQLVVSTILLQDNPVGNISYTVYEDLRDDDERVQLAIPLAFGDSYEGSRIIGTNHDFFEIRPSLQEPPTFQLADGRLFADVNPEDVEAHESDHQHGDHLDLDDAVINEVVLGATLAETLDLSVGDAFTGLDGQAYTVVGIFNPTNTPYDNVAMTQIESFWVARGDEHAADDNVEAEDDDHADDESIFSFQTLLVAPANPTSVNQLLTQFEESEAFNAALPDVTLLSGDDQADQFVVNAVNDLGGALIIGTSDYSPTELVENTLLLRGVPTTEIEYELYELFLQDARADWLVPMIFADMSGTIIIGTKNTILNMTDFDGEPVFTIADGRMLTANNNDPEVEHEHMEGMFEAVVGSRAAERLNLQIGDTFQGSHGLGVTLATDVHEEIYTVVGILEPTDTAYDEAIFTQVVSVWTVHDDDVLPEFAANQLGATNEVTAVLVSATSFANQQQIVQEFLTSQEAQVAFPGDELAQLFELIDQAQEILTVVAYLVLAIASLTVFLAMYNAIVARERAIAIMRGLGSSQAVIFRIVIFETLMVTLIGVVLGRLLAYPAAMLIAAEISSESTIPIPLRVLVNWELILLLVPLGVGAIAGLLPAMMAYRVNVVEKLFPS